MTYSRHKFNEIAKPETKKAAYPTPLSLRLTYEERARRDAERGDKSPAALSGVGGVQLHQAAAYCDGLSAHGQSDWNLPALGELDVLVDNKNAGELSGT